MHWYTYHGIFSIRNTYDELNDFALGLICQHIGTSHNIIQCLIFESKMV